MSFRRSSSASYSTPTGWDVFLSFYGKDTRHKFTSHLYSALERHGVRTFRDDPDLRNGEVISSSLRQAIKESKTCIVVLSRNYASSPWCLDELVEIINCYETMQKLVIPVFYNIDPSVVRHQGGRFKKAFQKHITRFETEKVNTWRGILTEIANFSGEHIVSGNSYEADIIDEIVDEILLKINPKNLDVAKYPVGLDSRVEDIATLLKTETKGITKIGIYGMGGVGKTTLAKALYNELLRGSFKSSCFLENVREVSGTAKGLISLQQQLINDVLKSKKNVDVRHVDQGMKLIGARTRSRKVLVVLDDLDDHKQFQSLVGPFACGSVVIITTRNEEILDTIKVNGRYRYRYRVNELDDGESLKLFTKHAFGKAEVDNTLMVWSKDILRLAGGLPMALEVFGSYLSAKKSEMEWKAYIEKLQRNPNRTIQQKLLISLEALELDDPELKKFFLDIACFFIGGRKEEVVKVLGTYYSYPDHYIDILKKRCLLTINSRDQLGMHDLLRDMGREVSRGNSPDEPEKHSRLWVSKDIYHVLKNHQATKAIEGIIHRDFEYMNASKKVSFAVERFKRMSKLRFLHLQGVNLTGSFEHAFKELRWLCWDRCPLKYFPPEFHLEKLVILELPRSKIIVWELYMVLENLKTLNMSDSVGLCTTPDFTKLPCLESLNLKGCKSLEEVHISVVSLRRLVSLDLRGCVKLRSLANICNLRALEALSIDNCISMETLPEELGKIESLKELNAEGLSISKLPNSIRHLRKLVKLNLRGSKNLESLPDTVCNLNSLKILDICGCEKLEILPDELWKLKRLREIHAGGATMLNKLPDIKPSQIAFLLRKLDLSECALTALPYGISWLSNLEELDLTDCRYLLTITELPPNLMWITVDGCTSLKRLPNLCNLKQLWELDLRDCRCLTMILGLEKLTSLRQLRLGGCNSSLLASIFTKHLFQMCCEFAHSIQIYASLAEFPYGMGQFSNYGSTMCIDLPPNMSHNFLGMILCFKHLGDYAYYIANYSVKNTTSDFIWRESFDIFDDESLMVIVPKSIFPVRNGEDRVELTTVNVNINGTILLYKTETKD